MLDPMLELLLREELLLPKEARREVASKRRRSQLVR